MSDIVTLQRILTENQRIAIVGLSASWYRPSYFAAKYLLDYGYDVIPVNPRYDEVLGCKCYPDLQSIPVKVDVVDCFRRSEDIPPIAHEAVKIGARVLWMQLGVTNQEARDIAESAGLDVIEDRCMKIEYARLFGGLNFIGVNTKVITSRRLPPPPNTMRQDRG
ncbi:MAG: CoA-binding protein [Pseudomonadota bacterium]